MSVRWGPGLLPMFLEHVRRWELSSLCVLGIALCPCCHESAREASPIRDEPVSTRTDSHEPGAAEIVVASDTRPASWATRIERPGLPNLHRVSPTLYRGAQPTDDGWAELARMGVKTVLSLRAFHGDRIPENVDLQYERISVKSWHPETEDVVRFLRIVTNAEKQPVFVHCEHGADRTGTMNAIYRIVVEGWSKADAIHEMTTGGYGFHPVWQNLVRYIEDLDVESVRRQLSPR